MKKLSVLMAVLCLLLCSCRSGKTDRSAADTPLAGNTGSYAAGTGLSATATGLSATGTGLSVTATGLSAAATGLSAAGTGSSTADTGSSTTDTDSSTADTGSSTAGTGSFSLDLFTGVEDTPADTLHDPGPLLDTEAKQADDVVIDDVTYRVYVYDFDEASSIKLIFYTNALEEDGYSIEKADADGDAALYVITGPDGVAVLRVYNPLSGSSPSWTLYVPTDMAFTPNQDSGSSDSSSGSISSSSFQNDILSGSRPSTGTSFQNDILSDYPPSSGSFIAIAEDPIVVDGMLICTQCDGSGICPYCYGLGTVRYDLHTRDTCVACDGTGICDVCDGTGNWGPA